MTTKLTKQIQPFQRHLTETGICLCGTPQNMRIRPQRHSLIPPTIYTGETVAQIVNCVPETIRPAVILVASNLFRMAEACSMTYEQLFQHWDAGWIWIPNTAATRLRGRYLTRWVPINPATRHLLTPYIGKSGSLCPLCKDEKAAGALYAKAMKRAGIPIVRGGLRTSCISAHFAIGVPMGHIARWAGNTEPVCTSHLKISTMDRERAASWAARLLGVGKDSPAVAEFFAALRSYSCTPRASLKAV